MIISRQYPSCPATVLVKFDDPVRFHSARRRGKASRDDFFRDFAKSIAHGEESGLPGMLLVEVNVKGGEWGLNCDGHVACLGSGGFPAAFRVLLRIL